MSLLLSLRRLRWVDQHGNCAKERCHCGFCPSICANSQVFSSGLVSIQEIRLPNPGHGICGGRRRPGPGPQGLCLWKLTVVRCGVVGLAAWETGLCWCLNSPGCSGSAVRSFITVGLQPCYEQICGTVGTDQLRGTINGDACFVKGEFCRRNTGTAPDFVYWGLCIRQERSFEVLNESAVISWLEWLKGWLLVVPLEGWVTWWCRVFEWREFGALFVAHGWRHPCRWHYKKLIRSCPDLALCNCYPLPAPCCSLVNAYGYCAKAFNIAERWLMLLCLCLLSKWIIEGDP